LKERLAEAEHLRWSNWQKYVFGLCTPGLDGTAVIPRWAVTGWSTQMNTAYVDLDESAKDSDRREAQVTIDIITQCAVESMENSKSETEDDN